MKFSRTVFGLFTLLTLLTACGSNATGVATVAAIAVSETEAPVTGAGTSSADEAEASPSPVFTEPVLTEEQVVLSSFSQPVTAGGEPLVLYGHVLDASGAPLSGYAVEIWQVDANGIYDHPGDANTANRDPGFQSYGTALTDVNGLFAFRTLVPARYEPRPRHIHFKVKKDGAELLTSQFYFAGDADAAQVGFGGEMLLLELGDAQDAGGNMVKLAFKDIVIDLGAGGNLAPTPSQTEGPYYPVIDVAAFDNDLASVLTPPAISLEITGDVCPSLEGRVGMQLAWTNRDDIDRMLWLERKDENGVLVDAGGTDLLQPGTTFSITLTESGQYTYYCSKDRSAFGTITVLP